MTVREPSRLGDDREHRRGHAAQVLASPASSEMSISLPRLHSRTESGRRGLEIGDRLPGRRRAARTARRARGPGSGDSSTSSPQTCSNGTAPDEILDVDAAVAERRRPRDRARRSRVWKATTPSRPGSKIVHRSESTRSIRAQDLGRVSLVLPGPAFSGPTHDRSTTGMRRKVTVSEPATSARPPPRRSPGATTRTSSSSTSSRGCRRARRST